MATKTVVCPECDAPLAPGRFSCSSCGALVASVATVSRSFTPEPVAPPAPEPAPGPAVEPAPDPEQVAEPIPEPAAGMADPDDMPLQLAGAAPDAPAPEASAAPRRQRIANPVPRKAKPAVDPVPAATTVATVAAEPVAPPPVAPPPVAPPPTTASVPAVPVRTAPSLSPHGEPEVLRQAQPVPSWPEQPVWPPTRASAIDLDAEVAPIEPVEPGVGRVPAGSYLPPSAVLPPGEALPMPGSARANGKPGHDEDARTEKAASRSLRLSLGDGPGPFGMPADAPTRIVLLGAGLSVFGFLLPWAEIVIGSGVMGGYLAQWGLAGPGHLLILALVAGIIGLTLLAERLPRWVRLGLPSIAVAFLLIGLAWPYLAGPFDASIGVYVVAIGAMVMIAGGLLDRIALRHEEPNAAV